MRIIIREILYNELEKNLEFSWRLSRLPSTNSYPLFSTFVEMKTKFERAIENESDKLYAVLLDGSLCGVVCLEVIPENHYIQTVGIYISNNFNIVMSEIFHKLRNEYTGYEIYLGYPKENTLAFNYCMNENFSLIESSIDFRLHSSEFTGFNESLNINRITEDNFERYAEYHEKQFQGIYWTSERLKQRLAQWRIYTHQTGKLIDGCIFLNVWENNCEIFGLSDTSNGKILTYLLLSQALSEVIKNDNVNNVIFFIEDNDNIQINAAKAVGFTYHSSYCCFKEKL